MKEFFNQYRKMQQTLEDIHQVELLLAGSEWVLKQCRKGYYKSFWLVEISKNQLVYNVYDGGGHCKEKRIALEKFEKILGQSDKERADWLAESEKTCKALIEKKKEDYEDRSLNSGLEQIKWAILENDKEAAQWAFNELMKEKL